MESDVLNAVVNRIKGDSTMRSLLGATATDDRVYFFHRGDAVVDSKRPAFVTFMAMGHGETTRGVATPVISFVVWGRTNETVCGVRDRLKALLDKQTLETATGRKYRARLVNEQDTYNEQANYVGKSIHVRAAYLD